MQIPSLPPEPGASATIPIGIAVVMMLLCLVVGFVLGTRGRQIAASAKLIAHAVRTFTIKIPGATSLLGPSTSSDEGEEREEEEQGTSTPELEDYLNPTDDDPTLNDHPDVQLNPVILHRIKRAKAELREAQRRAALLSEGFGENEVEDRMGTEAAVGGVGGGRQNPLALLISVGARVEAAVGGSSAEHQQLLDRRRLQRNVNAFLSKADGIDKYASASQGVLRRQGQGRGQTASDVSRETALHRFGGNAFLRDEANVKIAKDARSRYRRFKVLNPNFGRDHRRRGGLDQPKGLTRKRGGAVTGAGGGSDRGNEGGNTLLDAGALAMLQAEFEDGQDGDNWIGDNEDGDFDGDDGDFDGDFIDDLGDDFTDDADDDALFAEFDGERDA
jgi:hypothetical protein